MMAEASIPVDLFNPGQVFACLGFLEAADILLGDAEGGFDWHDETDVKFRMCAAGEENPFAAVLAFLAEAEVSSVASARSKHDTRKWNVPTVVHGDDDLYPFPDPSSPATLPALLKSANAQLIVDHWGEVTGRTKRDAVKFWAGSGGYPGAALMRDALALVRDRLTDTPVDPFSISAPQSSSFRFDWRRDYIPIDAGFSPNDHADMNMQGYPLVEILAAIGLGNARPQRISKLEYRYGVVMPALERFIDPLFLRAALGGALLLFPQRLFRMSLGWPGQENQARCITDVVEETDK